MHPGLVPRERLDHGPPHLEDGPRPFRVDAGSRPTGWTTTGAGFNGARSGTSVTTVLLGTTSAGSNLRHHLLRLLLRAVEELRHHLGPVLLRHHLGELGDVRDAEPSVSKRLRDLREPPEEPGRDLAVVGRTPGQPDLPVEEIEEAREAELPVHGRRSNSERARRRSTRAQCLAAGEIGDAEGPFACVHGSTFAREIPPSPERTRTPPAARHPARRSRTSPRMPIVAPRPDAASTGPVPKREVRGTEISPKTRQDTTSERPIWPRSAARTIATPPSPQRFVHLVEHGARRPHSVGRAAWPAARRPCRAG